MQKRLVCSQRADRRGIVGNKAGRELQLHTFAIDHHTVVV